MTLERALEAELADRIENPYWDIVKDLPGDKITLKYDRRWQPTSYPPLPEEWTPGNRAAYEEYNKNGPTRHNLVATYAWAIPAPESIAWMVETLAGRKVVEVGAGTGYWAWLLLQSGVDVNAYDKNPPREGWNSFHCKHEDQPHTYTQEERDAHRAEWEKWRDLTTGSLVAPGNDLPSYPPYRPLPKTGTRSALTGKPGMEWFPVITGGAEALGLPENRDRVLFLSWPPYNDDMGYQCIRAYPGDTLVLISEGEGGCCGDDKMWELLNDEWEHLNTGPLTQWWGLHDVIQLYVRSKK